MSPLQKQPTAANSDWHFWISMVKSGLRIIGCFLLFVLYFKSAATMFFLAEILGIVEELQ